MNLIEDLKQVIFGYYDDTILFLPKLAMGLIATLILYIFLSIVAKKIIKYIGRNSDDQLLGDFLKRIISFTKSILILLFFLYTIGQGGIATTIFGAATISSVVIGFAFKDIAENFLAGVIMAFNRPFRVGDIVSTTGVEGSITGMSLRETHIKTFDGKDVYVPNGQIIKNPLFNYTIDGFLRKSFTIGVDYGSDLERVQNILQTTMLKIPGVLQKDKPPKTIIKNLSPSVINIEIQYWLDTFNKTYSGVEINNRALSNALNDLEDAGIGMPGDILEIKNYNNGSFLTNS